ncbi:leucine-rich repeat-containing protein [Tanacetum coccineum]
MSRLYALSLKSNNLFGTIPSQICQLKSLQILDLSFNNLHGTIPQCVNNLTSMVQKGFLEQNKHHYNMIVNYSNIGYSDFVDNNYIDHLLIEWQGKVNEFSSILGLLKAIDLSSNNLTGQIPNEVTNLHGLLLLDLSNNSLVGEIPRNIGHMTELLTLNLSRNMFSGEIPPTMSDMTLLNNLDLSFNDLSGRIPLGTQLQTFNASRYIGNPGLCGRPLPNKCPGDEDLGVPPVGESDGDGESTDELQRWFYIGGATVGIDWKPDQQYTWTRTVSAIKARGVKEVDCIEKQFDDSCRDSIDDGIIPTLVISAVGSTVPSNSVSPDEVPLTYLDTVPQKDLMNGHAHMYSDPTYNGVEIPVVKGRAFHIPQLADTIDVFLGSDTNGSRPAMPDVLSDPQLHVHGESSGFGSYGNIAHSTLALHHQ